MRFLVRCSSSLLVLPLIAAGPADRNASPPNNEIVVVGERLPVIVNGRTIKCRPLLNDPQDSWVAKKPLLGTRRQSVLLPRPDGQGFELIDDEDQLFDSTGSGGAGVWRRAGTGIDQYVFRASKAGSLLCIGSKGRYPAGYAQLRQIVDGTPYRGKRVRFTAWAATRDAWIVNFWLASGDPNAVYYGQNPYGWAPGFHHPAQRNRGWIYDGGNTNDAGQWHGGPGWHGSHGWTPVLIEIGPISNIATIISFGFVLNGYGNVWLYDPKFEVVGPNDPYQRRGDVFVIGTDKGAAAAKASERN